MHFLRSTATSRRLLTLSFGLLLLAPVAAPLRAQTTAQAPQTTSNPANGKQTVLSETDQYRMSAPVVKLGALLGMKPETAANVFTLFNIFVLFAGIGYGLLKVLPKAFRNRTTAIQKHLVDARTATEEATARLSSVEARLSKLDEQIAAMRQQAEAEIQTATTTARRAIQKYAAELAIEQAARKLVVTAEADRLLVESFANKLGEGSKN